MTTPGVLRRDTWSHRPGCGGGWGREPSSLQRRRFPQGRFSGGTPPRPSVGPNEPTLVPEKRGDALQSSGVLVGHYPCCPRTQRHQWWSCSPVDRCGRAKWSRAVQGYCPSSSARVHQDPCPCLAKSVTSRLSVVGDTSPEDRPCLVGSLARQEPVVPGSCSRSPFQGHGDPVLVVLVGQPVVRVPPRVELGWKWVEVRGVVGPSVDTAARATPTAVPHGTRQSGGSFLRHHPVAPGAGLPVYRTTVTRSERRTSGSRPALRATVTVGVFLGLGRPTLYF